MVIFRPSDANGPGGPDSVRARHGAATAVAHRPSSADYRPLALAVTETIDLVDTATAQRAAEAFVRRETRPAPVTAGDVVGTIWRAGLLEELRNPRPRGPLARRVLCSSDELEQWLSHRHSGITATDAARLATPASVRAVANDKREVGAFGGNAFTEFGRRREPVIAEWVREQHGIGACGLLFHAADDARHLATPDGFAQWGDEVVLAEIKTTNKEWKRIPRNYLRQVWWQQYVVGAERTLFVWERHENFVVRDAEPRFVWIDRDDDEIAKLIALANAVLDRLALEAAEPSA